MAVSSKTSKSEFGASVLERLTFLDCDYVKGMEECAVADLVLSQGQGRFYILQWLFTRYDIKLSNLLNPTEESLSSRRDTALQRLLLAATAMCLCGPDDIDLIKGEGPVSRQMNFINKLLDLVCISERNFAPDSSFHEPTASQLNNYSAAVVNQGSYLDMLEDTVDLLPRDIRVEVEQRWKKNGWDKESTKDPPPLPNLQDLMKESENLRVEIEKHNLALNRLKEEIKVQGEGQHAEVASLNHVLCLAMRELSQLSRGFSQCYQTSVSQWCNNTPPELSQLGPSFHKVHSHITTLTKLLGDLKGIRFQSSQIDKQMRESQKISQDLVDTSNETSDNFESCLTVLEEALHRSASGFKQRPGLLRVLE